MIELLKEAEERLKLKLVSIERQTFPNNPDAISLKAEVKGGGCWVTASFPIEDQCFPPGSRGYDRTYVRGPNSIHLTPELAEKAYKAIEAAHEMREAVQLAEELQAILWHDGPDTEHDSDTLNQVANLAIKYGYGPKGLEEQDED